MQVIIMTETHASHRDKTSCERASRILITTLSKATHYVVKVEFEVIARVDRADSA